MSDWGGVPNALSKLVELERRIETLERRAPAFAGGPPLQSCCEVYCCDVAPIDTLSFAEVGHYCTTDIDEQGGVDLRLSLWCMVQVQMLGAAGAHELDVIVYFEVDGTLYVQNARLAQTAKQNDIFTLNNVNTIDITGTTATVDVYVQNTQLTDIAVLAVNLRVGVGPTDGSLACGEVAGS